MLALLKLPIDTVRDVPFDYMHLVCLGVVRNLIQLWLSGPFSVRIGPTSRKELSEKVVQASKHVPTEFLRKGRPLAEFDRWKATELCLLLLYTGPVVQRDILPKALYANFIAFHSAISILIKNLCMQQASYAQLLLNSFVSYFAEHYGQEHLSFNVHFLLHLADDVHHFGCRQFQCIPF